jgi:hypothetical protein
LSSQELSEDFRNWLWEFEFYSFRTSYAKDWGVDQDAWWPEYPSRDDPFPEEILANVSIPDGWSASASKSGRHLLFAGPSGSAFLSLAFAHSAGKPNCLIHTYKTELTEVNVKDQYRAPVESVSLEEVVSILQGLFQDPS